MGEYFMWANPAKNEKIVSDAFDDSGFVLNCACYATTYTTRAVETLLAGDWKDDPVVFIGDYFHPEDVLNMQNKNLIKYFAKGTSDIADHFRGYPYEIVLMGYEDIGGRFKESEGRKRTIYYINDTHEDTTYDGPFDIQVANFKYAYCKELKEFVSLGTSWDKYSKMVSPTDELLYDPLPKLLCARGKSFEFTGRWAGYSIGTTNEIPADIYSEIYVPKNA